MENVENIFHSLPSASLRMLNLIQKKSPISRNELCALLDKKFTSINRMIAPLIEYDFVTEHGTGGSTGGRKPLLYSINTSKHYVGAINISTTYVTVAVINFAIKQLISQKFEITPDSEPDFVLEKIHCIFFSELTELQIESSAIHGIGVSIFSSFNQEHGTIYRPALLYVNEKWIDYPLAQKLEKKFQKKIVIDKGTNAAAMLEYYYGKGKGVGKILYILCAMNIRSAVIANGEQLSVTPRYEDAFGHMTIDFDGEHCLCGNYGCVDCYTTIPFIINKVKQEIKKGCSSVLEKNVENITFKDVCQAANEGDVLASTIVASAGSALGIGLANYINLFCPDIVILSGLLVHESALYYNMAIETAQKRATFISTNNAVRFERNGTFTDAITMGAGSLIINFLLSVRE